MSTEQFYRNLMRPAQISYINFPLNELFGTFRMDNNTSFAASDQT